MLASKASCSASLPDLGQVLHAHSGRTAFLSSFSNTNGRSRMQTAACSSHSCRLVVVCDKSMRGTRIEYNSPTEGWLGESPSPSSMAPSGDRALQTVPREILSLLLSAPDNHYIFLGVSPDADPEMIKASYRRLSKQFHPDTTDLPIQVAAQKFVRLKEAHSVLSSPEKRRLYDWQLAQQLSEQTTGKFVWPYEVDQSQQGPGSRPRTARNAGASKDGVQPLQEQSIAALAFDGFVLIVAGIVIIYVLYFKNR